MSNPREMDANKTVLWRVFEDITHGWWGIEEDTRDGNTILYPKKMNREPLDGICRAHNVALAAKDAELAKQRVALGRIADLTARCQHDGGFDREIGPIGCNLGDGCLCIGLHPIARDALNQGASDA